MNQQSVTGHAQCLRAPFSDTLLYYLYRGEQFDGLRVYYLSTRYSVNPPLICQRGVLVANVDIHEWRRFVRAHDWLVFRKYSFLYIKDEDTIPVAMMYRYLICLHAVGVWFPRVGISNALACKTVKCVTVVK